jgi:hypothetical protein
MVQMARSISALVALCLCSMPSWAQVAPGPSQTERSCAGVANEVTKGRELNRELNAYAGQTVPENLQQRVIKHLTLVAKLKSECESGRDHSAGRK